MCQENIRTPRHYNHYRHNYFLSCLPPLIPNRLHAWLPHPEPGSATAFFLVKGSFALLADLVISIIIVGSLHWADFAVFWHHLVHKIELNKIGWINTFMLFTPNSDYYLNAGEEIETNQITQCFSSLLSPVLSWQEWHPMRSSAGAAHLLQCSVCYAIRGALLHTLVVT